MSFLAVAASGALTGAATTGGAVAWIASDCRSSSLFSFMKVGAVAGAAIALIGHLFGTLAVALGVIGLIVAARTANDLRGGFMMGAGAGALWNLTFGALLFA